MSTNVTLSIHAWCATIEVETAGEQTHWVRATFEGGQEVTFFAPSAAHAEEFAMAARKLWPPIPAAPEATAADEEEFLF